MTVSNKIRIHYFIHDKAMSAVTLDIPLKPLGIVVYSRKCFASVTEPSAIACSTLIIHCKHDLGRQNGLVSDEVGNVSAFVEYRPATSTAAA